MPELGAAITPATTFHELGMDSLNRIDLLAKTEIESGLQVADEEAFKIGSFGDLIDFVSSTRAG